MELHENEKSAQIPGYPKYFITTEGRVWSTYSNKWLKPIINKRGNHKRAYVSLGRGNKKYIHRLVAETFIPNLNHLPEVDHIDTNGLNNNVDNLKWCTHDINMENEVTKETLKKNTGWYVEIEYLPTHELFMGYDKASKAYNVSKQTILNHVKGRVRNPKWKLTGKKFKENT